MEVKVCIHCKISKVSSDKYFKPTKKNRTGFTGACRLCLAAQKRARYRKNKERSREQTMKWRENNKGKYNEYYVERYKNPEVSKKKKAYYEKNKETIRVQRQAYYQENKERIRAQKQEYRKNKKNEQ